MRAAPAVSCATCTKNMHMSIQGSGEHPTSPAQWLYGLWRALPGERLFCLLSALGNRTSPRSIDASTATSGPHAFAVRVIRNRHAHFASTASPPLVVTMANAPTEWDGIGIAITRTLFLVKRNIGKYFLFRGLTFRFCKPEVICQSGRLAAHFDLPEPDSA